jgi:hypothetical protein
MYTLLVVLLVLLLVGALPGVALAPSGWGYWPSGGIGLVLLIVVILLLLGRI